MHVKHVGELKSHASWSTTDKTSRLARQLAHDSNSRLVPIASSTHQNALFVRNLTVHIPHSPYYKYPYTHEILREKPQRKTRLTHPQSSSFDSLNSSTLTLSIDTFLKGTLVKFISHHTHICEEAFWYLGSSSEGINSFWLMQWAIAGSGKLEKIRFSVTLSEQETWRAQVHWVDQGLRVFCYSCILTLFSSRLLTAWRVVERFFAKDFGFLFDNTSLCCLCVCIFLHLIFVF